MLAGATPALLGAEKSGDDAGVHVVKKGSLALKTELEAVLESAKMHPISIEPEVFADLTVVDAVAHGARIKKGEVLLRLDPEKLEEQIEDLELGEPGAKLALEVAKAELENLKETTPLKMEAAERSKRRADEDLAYFQSTDREQREKSTKFNVRGSEERLAGAKEELDQLKKMYEADDLTEETEEIILKRQKFAVESAEFSLESYRLTAKRTLETSIPRDYENMVSGQRDASLALTLARETLPKALDQKKLGLEKLLRDQTKAEKKLADLRKDLKLLTVRAPANGLVYYGACEDGKWVTGAAVAKKLIPGGKVFSREIFMTIVDPEDLILRVVVPEDKLSKIQQGQSATASPISAPEAKLKAKVRDLDYVPLPNGSYSATLSMERDKNVRIVPGMKCKLVFGEDDAEERPLVPKTAVHQDGEQHHVYLSKEDGGHEKRTVKTGKSDDKMTEVIEGLSAGDKVLLKKPE